MLKLPPSTIHANLPTSTHLHVPCCTLVYTAVQQSTPSTSFIFHQPLCPHYTNVHTIFIIRTYTNLYQYKYSPCINIFTFLYISTSPYLPVLVLIPLYYPVPLCTCVSLIHLSHSCTHTSRSHVLYLVEDLFQLSSLPST